MNKIKELEKMKFKITWTLIQIGYLGNEIVQQIDEKDISEYCYSLLENEKENLDEVAQLIGEKDDRYEFEKILDKLVKKENSNKELQFRKWRVYLVKQMICNLDEDYIENLLNITEFWLDLGQPEDAPHIFQSVNNKITPKEYYTKNAYERIIKRHKEWIEKEIERIHQLEKC